MISERKMQQCPSEPKDSLAPFTQSVDPVKLPECLLFKRKHVPRTFPGWGPSNMAGISPRMKGRTNTVKGVS